MAYVKRTFTILIDSKRAEKEHTEATSKLWLATQENEHTVAISDLKLQIKRESFRGVIFSSSGQTIKFPYCR